MAKLRFDGNKKQKSEPVSVETLEASARSTDKSSESVTPQSMSVITPTPALIHSMQVKEDVRVTPLSARGGASLAAEDTDSDLESVGMISAAPSLANAETGQEQAQKKKKKGMFRKLKVPKALRGAPTRVKFPSNEESFVPPLTTTAQKNLDLQTDHRLASPLTADVTLSGTSLAALTIRLEEADQQRATLEMERDSLQNILESKDLTIKKLKNEVDDLETKLAAIVPNSLSPKLGGKLDDVAVKLSSIEAELKAEKEEKHKMEVEMTLLTRELEESRAEVSNLQRALTDLQRECQMRENDSGEKTMAAKSEWAGSETQEHIQRESTKISMLEKEVQMWRERAEKNNIDERRKGTEQLTSLKWQNDLEIIQKTQEEEKKRLTLEIEELRNEKLDQENQIKDLEGKLQNLERKMLRTEEEAAKLESECSSIKAEADKSKDYITKLKADLDASTNASEEIASDFEACKRLNDILTQRIKVLSNGDDTARQALVHEAEESRLLLEEKEHDLARVKQMVSEAQRHEERLNEKLRESESRLKIFEGRAGIAEDELARVRQMAEQEVTAAAASKIAVEKELNSQKIELVQIQVRLKDSEDKYILLKNVLEEIENEKVECERRILDLQRTLDENTRRDLNARDIQIEQLKATIEDFIREKRELTSELNAKTVEGARMGGEVSLLTMKLEVAEANNKDLQLRVKSITEQGSQMNTAMSAKELDFQRQVMELNASKEMQSVEIHNLQNKESDQKREIAELKNEIADLDEKWSNAKKELSVTQTELSILERKYADLSSENQQLKELNDELKRTSVRGGILKTGVSSGSEAFKSVDFSLLPRQASVLQDTLKSSQQQSFEVDKLRMRCQQLERTNEDLSRDVSNLNIKIIEIEETKSALQVDGEQHKSKVAHLEEQLRTVEKKLAKSEAQVGSMKVSLQEAFKRETNLTEEMTQLKRSGDRRISKSRAADSRSVAIPYSVDLSDGSDARLSLTPEGPPVATIFSNCIANVDGARNTKCVRCPEGTLEVVFCLKQRLLDCLFETFGPRVPDGQVLGGMFREVFNNNYLRSNMREATERPEVLRVLARIQKMWELGEDLRLALVQSDPTLAEVFQSTRTTHADWQSTLERLRGSAEIIEERNRTLEKLAGGYAAALDEVKTLARVDREKAKNIITTLKKQLRNCDEQRATTETEKESLMKENGELQEQLKDTLQDNARLLQQRNASVRHQTQLQAPTAKTFAVKPTMYIHEASRDARPPMFTQPADRPHSVTNMYPPTTIISPPPSPMLPATGSTMHSPTPPAMQIFKPRSPQCTQATTVMPTFIR